jgi:hypothetical protein
MRTLLPLVALVLMVSGCPESHPRPVPPVAVEPSPEPECLDWHYDPDYPDFTYCTEWTEPHGV